jgi:hypothetical protein
MVPVNDSHKDPKMRPSPNDEALQGTTQEQEKNYVSKKMARKRHV